MLFETKYIEFYFKLTPNDNIKNSIIITNYYLDSEEIELELKRKIRFCLDRYAEEFCLSKLDYDNLELVNNKYKFIEKEEVMAASKYNLFICVNNENFKEDYFIYNGDRIVFVRNNNTYKWI